MRCNEALWDAIEEIKWIRACNGYAESEPELWLTERLRRIEANIRSAIADGAKP